MTALLLSSHSRSSPNSTDLFQGLITNRSHSVLPWVIQFLCLPYKRSKAVMTFTKCVVFGYESHWVDSDKTECQIIFRPIFTICKLVIFTPGKK